MGRGLLQGEPPFLFLKEELMEAPTDFTERLDQAFGGRLRIRWSPLRQEFQIEQKVGRAVVAPYWIDEGNDDLIRARDGYDYIMSVRPGDRMPCPSCYLPLAVPVMDTEEISCGYCRLQGRATRVVAGFWPLDTDHLIEHLRKIDPLRGAQKELTAAADRRNRLLLESMETAALAPGYAAFDDNYNRLVGIPQVGFTGKEKMWDR
jgi:hypothetical protein